MTHKSRSATEEVRAEDWSGQEEKLGQASGTMVKVMPQKSLVKSHCTAILEIFIQDSQPEVRASNGVSLLPRLPRVG